ncbi:alpha/beta-hydrolase [Daldinia sp. FL1419]|nr:alpha/beta-hydrolase [Daldinia sp. FL1419]
MATNTNPPDAGRSEDCLFLDVYAPTKANRHSKLPVYFFIQGGGFNELSNPNYNGSGLIEASGNSIVVVTFNYRVGLYGFITHGDKITPNNGLRDQRKALQWVQDHISKFGGDPDHVVLGGDSAGAASISLQMVAYNGKETSLFHAAAVESVSFATVLTVDESQYLYDNFSALVGCSGYYSLGCLRNKTTAELQAQNTGIPYPGETKKPLYAWNPVLDDDLITDYTYNAFDKGKFVRVPVIYGDDTNGGTIFTDPKTSTLAESEAFLRAQFPYLTRDQLDEIDSLYPNKNDTCPSPGCYWRQVSDAYGDMRYMCPGLFISSAMRKYGVGRSFNYRYNVEDPDEIAQGYGVPHTIELAAIWGPEYISGTPPASYTGDGINVPVIPIIQAYWTSFIRTFDPNTHRHPDSVHWERWDPDKQNRLLFETGGNATMEIVAGDKQKSCKYFASIGADVRQ